MPFTLDCAATLLIALTSCGRVSFDLVVDGQSDSAVDAPPPFVCGALPCAAASTATMCGDRCFATCSEFVPADVALQRCIAWGGTLAVIRSVADNDCLVSVLVDQSWMGYVQSAAATTPGEQWTWLDGDPSTFVNWTSLEPNDGEDIEDGTEQCGEIYANGTWNDERCTIFDETFIACSH